MWKGNRDDDVLVGHVSTIGACSISYLVCFWFYHFI